MEPALCHNMETTSQGTELAILPLVATALISMGGRGHLYGVWKLLKENLSSCTWLDRSEVAQALKRLEKEGLVWSLGHEEGHGQAA